MLNVRPASRAPSMSGRVDPTSGWLVCTPLSALVRTHGSQSMMRPAPPAGASPSSSGGGVQVNPHPLDGVPGQGPTSGEVFLTRVVEQYPDGESHGHVPD
jgi:hypothetical protein